eukprot:13918144-Alexandrium_andersonii.AAC.1
MRFDAAPAGPPPDLAAAQCAAGASSSTPLAGRPAVEQCVRFVAAPAGPPPDPAAAHCVAGASSSGPLGASGRPAGEQSRASVLLPPVLPQ